MIPWMFLCVSAIDFLIEVEWVCGLWSNMWYFELESF